MLYLCTFEVCMRFILAITLQKCTPAVCAEWTGRRQEVLQEDHLEDSCTSPAAGSFGDLAYGGGLGVNRSGYGSRCI